MKPRQYIAHCHLIIVVVKILYLILGPNQRQEKRDDVQEVHKKFTYDMTAF